MKNKNYLNSQARAEGVKILGVWSFKKQEWGFSVGQPILIYVLVGGHVAGAIFSTIYDRRTNDYPHTLWILLYPCEWIAIHWALT